MRKKIFLVFFRFLSPKLSFMSRLVIFLSLALYGVNAIIAAQPESSSRSGASKPEASKVDYVLQPSDLIRVQIFQEDDLNREVRISQENTVKLPLIDIVSLKGKTARQAEEYIRDLYGRDFLAKPQVNLFVLEYAPRRVFLVGAVNKPGVVMFQQEQGLTLIAAISQADSFNRLADKKRVTLKRTNPDGTTETFTINVEDLTKGETNQTWPLQPNDVITVPEKLL
jgi:polysaccharide export outer membrane protein